jgi:hypothetical protein
VAGPGQEGKSDEVLVAVMLLWHEAQIILFWLVCVEGCKCYRQKRTCVVGVDGMEFPLLVKQALSMASCLSIPRHSQQMQAH